MRIDNFPNYFWRVNTNGRFDSQWTSRREARQRRSEIYNSTDTIKVTLAKVPVEIGQAVESH